MSILQPLIAAYASILSQPIALIFTVLSALQVFQGVRRIAIVRRRWSEFVTNPLIAWKRQIGQDIAFYVAVPVGVLIHELGHALVVWLFGGRVLEFGYFFFWGFVLPDRQFQPAWRTWVLSASGTIGSLLLALIVALLLWRHRSAAIRFAAKRTVRFQIYFALIYYPAFTALTRFGDWRTIYDFQATPLLSGATAIVHGLILLAFWQMDKRDVFDEAGAVSAETQTRYNQLSQSGNISDQIDAILLLGNESTKNDLRRKAQALFQQNPTSGDAEMLLAITYGDSLEKPHNRMIQHAKSALKKQLVRGDLIALANYCAGYDQWVRGKSAEAVDYFSEAIRAGHQSTNPEQPRQTINLSLFIFYYMRAIANHALRRPEAMQRDMQHAIQLAEARKATSIAKRYKEELVLMQGRRR